MGVTPVSAPGPRPAEEWRSFEAAPGDPSCLNNEPTGREPAWLHGVGAGGLPRDRARAGHDEAPARRGDTGHPSLYPTRVCFRLLQSGPGRPGDASTLGPEHPEVCGHAITRPYSPPQLAEPREDFLGATSHPSRRCSRCDRWGPDAAGLSAGPSGARTAESLQEVIQLPFRRAEWQSEAEGVKHHPRASEPWRSSSHVPLRPAP